MEKYIIFSLFDPLSLSSVLSEKLRIPMGSAEVRNFPDGETYIHIHSDVQNKTVILVSELDHPNHKILSLMFMAQTLKELGAKKICLISPYLPYMRQDKRFKPGEAITSVLFAKFISGWLDCLITIDPHLHRIHHLSEIYTVPAIATLHATKKIAAWISENVISPFIIGPDEESQQWVAAVAKIVDAPYIIIKKTREGDRKITISIPEINDTKRTPVLVDDIISTGTSMLVTIQQLLSKGFTKPICIGVHALFKSDVYENLLHAGAQRIITCNTVQHPSNLIDITDLLLEGIKSVAIK